MKIRYKSGYKYQLYDDFSIKINGIGGSVNNKLDCFYSDYISINDDVLYISAGYAWDGPSGPTIDTKSFMRGSLVHDALYQLIRGGIIRNDFRINADGFLKEICIEDGMNRIVAEIVYRSVRMFGGMFVGKDDVKEVLFAP